MDGLDKIASLLGTMNFSSSHLKKEWQSEVLTV